MSKFIIIFNLSRRSVSKMSTFISWKYKHYFEVLSDVWDVESPDVKNIKVKCKLCNTAQKTLSTSKSSTSNLLKHLKNVHATTKLLEETDKEPPCKQKKLMECVTDKSTSHHLKKLLASFIIEDMQPLSVVESPAFITLIRGLCEKPISVPCRKTLTVFIDDMFENSNKILVNYFAPIKHVCTTADIWTANNKSFFGMTAHWICTDSMTRKKAAIACSRFYGSHTYDAIAEEIFTIHNKYNITPKITATVTDNASNFVKAFRVFQEENVEDRADEQDNECSFVDLDYILNTHEDSGMICLPPHKRCAAHTINLVCKSLEKIIHSSPQSTTFKSAMFKCTALWNKSRRSTSAAEIIEKLAKMKLVIPTETRWNSQYNALKKIIQIDLVVLSNIYIQTGLKPLTNSEIALLKQYVDITQPLAEALNILQGEDHYFYGTLLPVLYTLTRKLKHFENNNVFPGAANNVIEIIEKRFANVFNDKDARLAAVSNPFFKNLFASDFEEKQSLRKLLLEEMKSISEKEINIESCSSSKEREKSFFDFEDESSIDDNIELEINNYLRFCKDVTQLSQYPK